MMNNSGFKCLLNDYLLIEGKYEILLRSISDDVRFEQNVDFELSNHYEKIDVKIDLLIHSRIAIMFSIFESVNRITFSIANEKSIDFRFVGIRKLEQVGVSREDFFDHHFSLKDHVRQMDKVLRYTEGNDDISNVFKAMRYEMMVNQSRYEKRFSVIEDHFAKNGD